MRNGTSIQGREGEGDDDAEPLEELPTEFAFATDGVIYVNARGIEPSKLVGRKMFHGYALTPEEAGRAISELHRIAFNVTIAAQPKPHATDPPPKPPEPAKPSKQFS